MAVRVFTAHGAGSNAKCVADHLVDANLAGHDSHGIIRVPQYVSEIKDGVVQPAANPEILQEWSTGCTMSANGAFGHIACRDAMTWATTAAKQHGLAAVTIRDCNHTGRIGAWVEQAAAEDMVGIVMVNAGGGGQYVAPFGGRSARLATNPIAIGAPSGGSFPIVLDMGTSVAPEGKIRHFFQKGQPVPDGWLIDHEGQPTNDPGALYANPPGAILPLGGPAGHKGFGLSFLVDVLAGAISQAGCSRSGVDHSGGGHGGILVLALNIERYVPIEQFHANVTELVGHIQGCPTAPNVEQVLVPGEWEHRQRTARAGGIDIPDETWRQLQEVAAEG